MKKTVAYSLLLLLAACGGGASAPTSRQVQALDGWRVLVANEGKSDMLCYAGASPVESEGTVARREGQAYLMATRRASGKIEISTSAGYPFRAGSTVELTVDDDSYSLFSRNTVAWSRSDADDKDLVAALKDADDIEVRGLSEGGLSSVDYYSSDGFAEAIASIRNLCP